MTKYPIFLNLENQRVVIIGGGLVAARKAQAIIDTGARLVVIAPRIEDSLKAICQQKGELIEEHYDKRFLPTSMLVIAATEDRQLNERIFKHCSELQILCNIVDQPDLCHFFVPAVIKRGPLQFAISTNGKCPAYAGHLRKKLEKQFTEIHGRFCENLEKIRNKIIDQIPSQQQKTAILGQLVKDDSFEYFKEKGPNAWNEWALNLLKNSQKENL